MSEPKISVIIPVRNGAEKIERCLETVLAQSCKPYEVLVVDGHSDDGTVERAGKFTVRILYEDYRSRGGACQVGVKNAEGEYVAFTDADCIPDKDWLANLVKEFNNGIIGVGGGIKNIERSFWERSISLAMNTFLGGANTVQARLFKTQRFVKSISGCNSMYRRKDILKIGGFNTSLPGAEDADLNRRLLRKGRLLHLPQAFVLHDHGRGVKGFAKQMFRYGSHRGIAGILSWQVIPPLLVPLVLLSLIFTRWLFLGLFFWYLMVVMAMSIKFAIQERDLRLLFSIPVAYIVEHTSYIAGFWRALIFPYKRLRRGRDLENDE